MATRYPKNLRNPCSHLNLKLVLGFDFNLLLRNKCLSRVERGRGSFIQWLNRIRCARYECILQFEPIKHLFGSSAALNFIFILKSFIHKCATCSELPSHVVTMGRAWRLKQGWSRLAENSFMQNTAGN